MMVECLIQEGFSHCSSDLLMIYVKTGSQVFKQEAMQTPSGHGDFLDFFFSGRP